MLNLKLAKYDELTAKNGKQKERDGKDVVAILIRYQMRCRCGRVIFEQSGNNLTLDIVITTALKAEVLTNYMW